MCNDIDLGTICFDGVYTYCVYYTYGVYNYGVYTTLTKTELLYPKNAGA